MVLVDTSVWNRFLMNRLPYARELQRLLLSGTVAGHDLIYGELLIGDPGGRLELLRLYGHMHRLPTVSHAEVVSFVGARHLHGCGIGWIDAHILASAVVADVPLWTIDAPLAKLASQFGMLYAPERGGNA